MRNHLEEVIREITENLSKPDLSEAERTVLLHDSGQYEIMVDDLQRVYDRLLQQTDDALRRATLQLVAVVADLSEPSPAH